MSWPSRVSKFGHVVKIDQIAMAEGITYKDDGLSVCLSEDHDNKARKDMQNDSEKTSLDRHSPQITACIGVQHIQNISV